jgi:hypothetical protein
MVGLACSPYDERTMTKKPGANISAKSALTQVGLSLVLALAACSDPEFDGLYQVASYSLVEGDCAGAGTEVEREFSQFRIVERDWLGLTIYPVFPCDGVGNCDSNNHGLWNLVTVEEDSGDVSMTSATNFEDGCMLSSMQLIIYGDPEPESSAVVLERRMSQVVVEPYVASECTTDRARSLRRRMECVQVLRLIGTPDVAETTTN